MKKLSINEFAKEHFFLKINELVDENEKLRQRILKLEGKGKKAKAFVPPTAQEIADYAKENGYSIDSSFIWNYYNDANWKDSRGKPVLNWKQKIRAVWFKDDKKIKQKQIYTPLFNPL